MTAASPKPVKVNRMVLPPQEPLTTGGPAEELERRIQDTFKAGYEHVVIDLRGVPTADSGGIRALVRGHTSAQRLSRRFTLVSPNPRVRELLELSLLTRVLEVVESLGEVKARSIPWDRVLTGVAVAMVGARSEEHTSELQSPCNLVCRLLLEKKKYQKYLHFDKVYEKKKLFDKDYEK